MTYLRRSPHDIQGALDLVHYFLVCPVDVQISSGTAYITHLSPSERTCLADQAASLSGQLRSLSKYLAQHPSLLAALRYKYAGIGKGKGVETAETTARCQRFEQCLEEMEAPGMLNLLVESTDDWLVSYEARVEIITYLTKRRERHDARQAGNSVLAGSERSSRDLLDVEPPSKRTKVAHSVSAEGKGSLHQSEQLAGLVQTKKPSTADRGTSPIKHTTLNRDESSVIVGQAVLHPSVSLSGSEYRTASQGSQVPPFEHLQQAKPDAHSSQETPPSPVSLGGSPPPPAGQGAALPVSQAATESQRTESDSSGKSAERFSLQSLSVLPSSATAGSPGKTAASPALPAASILSDPFGSLCGMPNPTPAFHTFADSASPASYQINEDPDVHFAETQQLAGHMGGVPSPQKRLVEAAAAEALVKRRSSHTIPLKPIFDGLVFPNKRLSVSSSPEKSRTRRSSSAVSFADIERISPEQTNATGRGVDMQAIESFLAEEALL